MKAIASAHSEAPGDPAAALDGAILPTCAAAGWSDLHSNVSLWWPDPHRSGLQALAAQIGWGGTAVTGCLLSWVLRSGRGAAPPRLVGRTFRPDRVVEVSRGDGLTLTATVAFAARNALAVEFEVANAREHACEATLEFLHPATGADPDWNGPFRVPDPCGATPETRTALCVPLAGEPEGSWATVVAHREHGRQVEWVRSFAVGHADDSHEFVCLADLRARPLRIVAGGHVGFELLLAFGTTRWRAREAWKDASANRKGGPASARAATRLLSLVGAAPPLPPDRRSPVWLRHYAHAITGLHSLFIRGEGGYTCHRCVPWTGRSGIAIAFFWDTAFACLGMARVVPELCRQAIEAFCGNPSPRGGLPGTLSDSHRAGEGQAPVMAYAALETYRAAPDRDWLARVWPGLSGYVRFWKRCHSAPNGLYLWSNAGQIADNDVRFDRSQGAGNSNGAIGGFWSPDMQAFVIVELRCLARLAGELGRRAEADAYREEAARLGELLVETMWFPEDELFRDVVEGTRTPFSDALSPNYFLPFWAGVPLPAETCRRSLRRHLLDPATFFSDRPFPSCARNHPKYDPGGYWRGRVWPPISYLLVQTLAGNGFAAEARLAADRLLAMLTETPWMHENYYGDPPVDALRQNGQPDYNWGLGIALLLLCGAWHEPRCWADEGMRRPRARSLPARSGTRPARGKGEGR